MTNYKIYSLFILFSKIFSPLVYCGRSQEQVQNDKFFFGSILLNSKPEFIENEKIELEVEAPGDEEIIQLNQSYLDSKLKEVFGKKLKVGVKHKSNKAITDNNRSKDEETPIVKAILNELGGREIKK